MGNTAVRTGGFVETLQDFVTLQRVAGEFGLRMRSYHKAGCRLVVETDEGPKEVRRLRHDLGEYRFACEAMDHLRGQGFSRLPRVAWSPAGGLAVKVGGEQYTMHDWPAGHPADLNNVCQLTQAVEMLAWFHRCGQGFHPVDPPAARDDWGSWPRRFAASIEDLQRLAETARTVHDGDRFARQFLKHFDAFLDEAARSLEEIERSDYQRSVEREKALGGLCHRGYTGEDLILREDGTLHLTEFSGLCLDSRLDDLGTFLVHQGRWDLGRTLFILQVYHGVNPITRADVQCLVSYLRFPHGFHGVARAHFAGEPAERQVLKAHATELPSRLRLLDSLSHADLRFLEGASPLYNLAFASLSEVPAGKEWMSEARWTDESSLPADAADWPWQAAPGASVISMSEPSAEYETSDTVLEEAGIGGGTIWPEPVLDIPSASQTPLPEEAEREVGAAPNGQEPEGADPVARPGSEAPTPEPQGGGGAVVWRAFPTPLRGQHTAARRAGLDG